MSLPAWGAWIEISVLMSPVVSMPSLPAWGAWIEIQINLSKEGVQIVAPRMGSVD